MRYALIAGCFDPFPHPGHLWAIRQAIDAGVCDRVIVALHADPSAERPAKSRCYLSVEERTAILLSLRWVEMVVPYATEADLLQLLANPPVSIAIRILGDDYIGRSYTGDNVGIPVFYAQRKSEWSATEFRDRIKWDRYYSK